MNTTISLADIEAAAGRYAAARAKLADRVAALDDELRLLKRRAMPGIRHALAAAQERKDELRAMLEAAPDLFERPKSVIFHGVRVGYQKGRGSLTWDDDAAVCARIRKLFPDQVDTLIKVIERPLKTALANLATSDLRKLGIDVIETGEEIVIRPVDGDLDKLIDRLLEDDEQPRSV